MPIGNHISFQCDHCGGRIPWQLNRSDIGLSDREEPRHRKTYPYEKCVCGGGKFVRCVFRHSEPLPDEPAATNTDVKKKVDSARYEHLPLRVIHPNPKQPRRFFDKVALQSLADSLATVGLLEDILVRKDPKAEGFEIVMGERRWRAAQIAGLPVISCKIVELQDDEAKILSLVENVQRENLTAVEEAFSFKEYIDRGISVNAVGNSLGRLTDRVAGKLKLLSTPQYIEFQEERIQELTRDNENLRTTLLSLQKRLQKKFESKILSSPQELLTFINQGWEFVARLSSEEFLVRREQD
jgi:ParB/RepB/Spo0J family partition protein